jgi:two-component SAPR family response regulator
MQDWQTQSVREFFFYMLSTRRALTREQIGERLWPEATEPAKLKLRFKNELYRLRRAVGRDVILYDGVGYRFNQATDHDLDVDTFEAHLVSAQTARTELEAIKSYRNAIDLVRGPYLEDVDAVWAWPERERLNKAFLAALLGLASLLEDAGQMSEAKGACQRALDFDPTCEAAYRQLMRIFHQVGDRQSLIHLFAHCEKMLGDGYELPLSDETKQLYRELIG